MSTCDRLTSGMSHMHPWFRHTLRWWRLCARDGTTIPHPSTFWQVRWWLLWRMFGIYYICRFTETMWFMILMSDSMLALRSWRWSRSHWLHHRLTWSHTKVMCQPLDLLSQTSFWVWWLQIGIAEDSSQDGAWRGIECCIGHFLHGGPWCYPPYIMICMNFSIAMGELLVQGWLYYTFGYGSTLSCFGRLFRWKAWSQMISSFSDTEVSLFLGTLDKLGSRIGDEW